MKPKAKLFVYGIIVTVVPAEAIGTVVALIHFGIILAIAGSASVIVTTFFASSSKFAKEVLNIIEWHKVMRCSLDEYPQTPGQKVIARKRSYPELEKLARAVNHARNDRERLLLRSTKTLNVQQKRYHQNSVAASKILLDNKRSAFNRTWDILSYVDSLPIDPRTGKQYKDQESFIELISQGRNILAYA
jgi:hypothetical protein